LRDDHRERFRIRREDAVVADQQGRDASSFHRFLGNPHPPMPSLQLSSSEIEDLVAFLVASRQP
jgi:hypothetical protein